MFTGQWADGESCVTVSQTNSTSVDKKLKSSPNVIEDASSPCLSTFHSFYLCFLSEMKIY